MSEADTETIRQAVHETLLALGLDAEDPTELQKDMAFLRSWRESTGTVGRTGLIGVVGLAISGACSLIWLALKQVFGGQP